MTKLLQRLHDELVRRHYATTTRESYLRIVKAFHRRSGGRQRDGLRVRLYSVSPGETMPCAVFPGDDLVVASLRADFSGVDSATLSVTGPGNLPMSEFDEIPVSRSEGEVLWALPGAAVHQMPSTRLQLRLTSKGTERAVLGEYVLEHLASDPSAR